MNINEMSVEELLTLLDKVEEYNKYNKIHSLKPYDYQKKFMNASAHYKQRMIRSGNRTGKTFGCALELAYHITGLYPKWFEGERFTNSGHIFWCIGITSDSTRKVMQKELMGTIDIRVGKELGTGTIPRDVIDTDYMVKDGARLLSCRVKHVDGGVNELHFYAASAGQDTLMGTAVKFVWSDEEPPHNSMEIYAQCITRTAVVKGNDGENTMGHIMYSATPEQGMSELQKLYAENTHGMLYIQSVSMYDAPHLSDDVIQSLLANYPEYQRDMRLYGLPVLGSGAVFPMLDSLIMCERITPLPHWRVCASVDWGDTTDPTVVSFQAYDPDNDAYYIYDQYLLDGHFGEDNDRSPESVARVIKSTHTPNIPIIVPHDSGIKTNQRGKGAQLIHTGVNVQRLQFENPAHLIMEMSKAGANNPSKRSIEVGLEEMRRLFQAGKLKVSRECMEFFREKNAYFYTGNKAKPFAGDDHCIDAARYGILSLVGNRGVPFGQCQKVFEDFNNGWDYDDDDDVGLNFTT